MSFDNIVQLRNDSVNIWPLFLKFYFWIDYLLRAVSFKDVTSWGMSLQSLTPGGVTPYILYGTDVPLE